MIITSKLKYLVQAHYMMTCYTTLIWPIPCDIGTYYAYVLRSRQIHLTRRTHSSIARPNNVLVQKLDSVIHPPKPIKPVSTIRVLLPRHLAPNPCSVSLRPRQAAEHPLATDDKLGMLADTGSFPSKLYFCWLHALTSHCLPDFLTGRTGTEECWTGP